MQPLQHHDQPGSYPLRPPFPNRPTATANTARNCPAVSGTIPLAQVCRNAGAEQLDHDAGLPPPRSALTVRPVERYSAVNRPTIHLSCVSKMLRSIRRSSAFSAARAGDGRDLRDMSGARNISEEFGRVAAPSHARRCPVEIANAFENRHPPPELGCHPPLRRLAVPAPTSHG